MPKVSGSSIATPGRADAGQRADQDADHHAAIAIMMLNGVSATPNPIARFPRKSR